MARVLRSFVGAEALRRAAATSSSMPGPASGSPQEEAWSVGGQGVVYDKWPFRLDISVEYQDWILVGVCILITFLWTLPCFCGRLHSSCSRAFTSWVYTRLHVFYWTLLYATLVLLMCTIGVLPDWTIDEFAQYLGSFISWILVHLVKVITSFAMLFGFFLLYKLRDRVLMAAGMEHIKIVRWKWGLGFGTKNRPVEIFVWKLEGLQSSGGKVMKANDVFVECHMGDNEPVRTRVHNNAGRDCLIKESFQVNIDENRPNDLMHVLVKDQSLVASSEVARLVLSCRELCGIEDQTGKRRVGFTYSEKYFVPLSLSPRGQVWLAVAPVDEADEGNPDEDAIGVTC